MTTLRKGSKGSEVSKLQNLLKLAGENVVIDGDFGNQTETAVKNFKKKRQIVVDGVVGSQTWGVLDSILYEAIGRATVKALEDMGNLPSVDELLSLL